MKPEQKSLPGYRHRSFSSNFATFAFAVLNSRVPASTSQRCCEELSGCVLLRSITPDGKRVWTCRIFHHDIVHRRAPPRSAGAGNTLLTRPPVQASRWSSSRQETSLRSEVSTHSRIEEHKKKVFCEIAASEGSIPEADRLGRGGCANHYAMMQGCYG